VTGSDEDSCHEQADQEPADVGEGDPPPFAAALNTPKLASMSWHRNHTRGRRRPGSGSGKEHEREDPRASVEDEVGAQHGGDGAARAEGRHLPVVGRRRPPCSAAPARSARYR